MSKIGRPRIRDKKTTISLTINSDLNDKLDKYLTDNELSKSEYIEYLIQKDKQLKL